MSHFFRPAIAAALTLIATAVAANAQSTITPSPPASSPAPSSSASAAPSPAASAANPPENTLVTARVKQEFSAWQHGRIDRMSYSPVAGGVYIDALVKVVEPDLAAIGEPQTVTYDTTSLLLGDFVYRYEVTGTTGVVSVLFSLDQRGKTDGIVFTPKIFTTPAPSP